MLFAVVEIPALQSLAPLAMGEEGSALAASWPHAFGFRRAYSPNPSDTLKFTDNTSDLLRKECGSVKPGEESECIPV